MIKFGEIGYKMIKEIWDVCHNVIWFGDVCHKKFEPEELSEWLEVLIFRLAHLGPPALSTKVVFLIYIWMLMVNTEIISTNI